MILVRLEYNINRQSCMMIVLTVWMQLNIWVCNEFMLKKIEICDIRIIINITEFMLYKTNLCFIIILIKCIIGGLSYEGACV